jgi:uncharacterized protein (DUF2267 family)
MVRPTDTEVSGTTDPDFVDEVAERTGVRRDTALPITEGTLLTVAARISGGEAEDRADPAWHY